MPCQRWLALVVSLVLVLSVPAAAAPPVPSAFPAGTIKVGVARPAAMLPALSEEFMAALDMAVNRAAGMGGTIELVVVDSGCNGETAGDALQAMIDNDGIHYVLGAVCSSASAAMAPIAEANGVVMVTPLSDRGDITHDGETNYEYVFAFPMVMESLARAAAAEIQYRGLNTPVVIYDAGRSDMEMRADVFDDAWQALGGDPLLKLDWDPQQPADAILGQAQSAGADSLAYIVSAEYVDDLAAAATRTGIGDLPVFGGETWDFDDFDCSLLGEGYSVTDAYTGGARAEEASFLAELRAGYGCDTGQWALLCYDAANVLFDAIATAGVDDPAVVRQVLADSQYDGVTGTGGFDKYGEAAREIHVVRWEPNCDRTFVRSWAAVSGLKMDVPAGFWAVGQAGDLSASIWNGSSVDYAWSFGDGNEADGQDVSHTFTAAGTYTVTVTAECPLCIEAPTASQAIEVYDLQPKAYVPFVER